MADHDTAQEIYDVVARAAARQAYDERRADVGRRLAAEAEVQALVPLQRADPAAFDVMAQEAGKIIGVDPAYVTRELALQGMRQGLAPALSHAQEMGLRVSAEETYRRRRAEFTGYLLTGLQRVLSADYLDSRVTVPVIPRWLADRPGLLGAKFLARAVARQKDFATFSNAFYDPGVAVRVPQSYKEYEMLVPNPITTLYGGECVYTPLFLDGNYFGLVYLKWDHGHRLPHERRNDVDVFGGKGPQLQLSANDGRFLLSAERFREWLEEAGLLLREKGSKGIVGLDVGCLPGFSRALEGELADQDAFDAGQWAGSCQGDE